MFGNKKYKKLEERLFNLERKNGVLEHAVNLALEKIDNLKSTNNQDMEQLKKRLIDALTDTSPMSPFISGVVPPGKVFGYP